MEFLIATNNPNKLIEIKRILASFGHTGVGLEEAGVRSYVEEDGKTYADNAAKKAEAACRAGNRVAIGDDSGLEVRALGGAPGMLSARFAGNHATDGDNNKKLLALLERTPYAGRGATFVCVVSLATPEGASLAVEGRCEGTIGFTAMGEGGFGYDPLFVHEGQSFANMSDEQKDAVSHRGEALRLLVEQLPQLGIS